VISFPNAALHPRQGGGQRNGPIGLPSGVIATCAVGPRRMTLALVCRRPARRDHEIGHQSKRPATIMRGGAKPAIRKLAKDALLTEQGEPRRRPQPAARRSAQRGGGPHRSRRTGRDAAVGELALLENGRRTATLRAVTDCVIATAAKDQIDQDSLARLAELHHRGRLTRLAAWSTREVGETAAAGSSGSGVLLPTGRGR
jgi:CRP-like cAMP-binding protein